ncbi:LytR/AlgR family response regulator transcription factor [Xanthovirga aplysinae]|uniref:LytR/AlgR family response regulator transcription factor n=1 Tax=Xanthovirga aplysinae TaxID=2529853 RepID=UPI0012BB7692|nr:LytTR family DNA-binding domain-containing protein [Xanthovirga aplysinae]MTI29938.1 response regulator transcription factor [Xanthovirga aplysinae]
MNILILEDETPAYRKLVNHLQNYFGDQLEHRHVKSVREGISILSGPYTFDLILSDIKLLDGTSFEVFKAVSVNTPIIFCTAFDDYLLDAFNTNGIAYILKPYSQKDIEDAINKYQNLFQTKPIENNVFEEFKTLLKQERKAYKKRFAIKKKSGIQLVEIDDVSYIEAYGDLCKLIDIQGNQHLFSNNIGSLIIDLDPSQFFRINRSQIVSIKHIVSIEPYAKNRLSLMMVGLDKNILTSTTTTKDFRKWLEQ